MSVTYFSLFIDNLGYLTATINSEIVTLLSTPVPSTDWTLIAVTFALHPSVTEHYIMISIGGSSNFVQSVYPAAPIFAYNPKNRVSIGGPGSFLGSIYDFRIYEQEYQMSYLTKISEYQFCIQSIFKIADSLINPENFL